MELNKVKVYDKDRDFRLLVELPFEIASTLNVGDIIHPQYTGFSFIITYKGVSMKDGEYELVINVKEYFTVMDKVKILLGLRVNSYWKYIDTILTPNRKIWT